MTFRFVIKSTRDFSSIDMFLTYENIIKWIDAFSISHLCQFLCNVIRFLSYQWIDDKHKQLVDNKAMDIACDRM